MVWLSTYLVFLLQPFKGVVNFLRNVFDLFDVGLVVDHGAHADWLVFAKRDLQAGVVHF